MKPLLRLRFVLTFVLPLAAMAALALGAARSLLPTAPPAPLAGYVPAGALLAIESPDFAAVLNDWSRSPERAAWTHSDNYAVFSNSRLFSRLADAQKQFAGAAGVLPDLPLLHGVAGKESLFAWYDIGALEFVYITRMPAGQSAQSSLLRARSGFARREAAGTTFFVRTVPGSGIDGPRTVAFAQVADAGGDLLLLATREDLLADALKLIAPGHTGGDSLAAQTWFREASAAALPASGDARPVFHMTLDLARIVPSPYFRSYWIERNVTEMKGFRAAVTDLSRDSAGFREERTLLPAAEQADGGTEGSPRTSPPAPRSAAGLAALAPTDRGVFRAVSTTDAAVMAGAVEAKLGAAAAAKTDSGTNAPNPALDVTGAGSANDLETRIDAPAPATDGSRSHPLEALFTSVSADGLLTVDTAAERPAGGAALGAWVQTRSAVVVRAGQPWTEATVAEALGGSVGESLTAAKLGFGFAPLAEGAAGEEPGRAGGSGDRIFTLTGPKRLFFAVRNGSAAAGNLLLLANDLPLLRTLLSTPSSSPVAAAPDDPESVAGFSHTAERSAFTRLTTALDRPVPDLSAAPDRPAGGSVPGEVAASPATAAPGSAAAPSAPPPFFSGNLRSLSDTFRELDFERITERRVPSPGGTVLRQTVVYRWAATP